ncbi:MAG: TldD/PmbA family protein [bacterium]|nr:TldD/PmbA family protein [bacterium]
MKREIARYLMKEFQKKGADDVVVCLTEDTSSQIKFSNNLISATQDWRADDLSVFASIKKKLVTTSIKDFSKKAADDTIKDLIKFAKSVEPSKEYEGIADGPFKYNSIQDGYDKKIKDMDGGIVDLTRKGINIALENGAKRTAGVTETHINNVFLLTSNGVEAEEKATKVYFSIRSFMDKYASAHYVSNSRMLKDLRLKEAAENSALVAKKAKNPTTCRPGLYDVVFEPLPFANLVEQMGTCSSIFYVEAGLSCLSGKLGTKIADEQVNITDDGTLKGGMNSARFDAEGVPTKVNKVVEDGIFKTYLHNTSTAKRHDTVTTANAGIITPLPYNTVLKKGNYKKEELLQGVKRGLLVTNVWYTRFQNYETGDFSTIPRDAVFLIENGKIKHPVKDLRITENLINVFKNVAAIGNDPWQIRSWDMELPVITPATLVKNVRITKSVE